jgi:hypothetical protein
MLQSCEYSTGLILRIKQCTPPRQFYAVICVWCLTPDHELIHRNKDKDVTWSTDGTIALVRYLSYPYRWRLVEKVYTMFGYPGRYELTSVDSRRESANSLKHPLGGPVRKREVQWPRQLDVIYTFPTNRGRYEYEEYSVTVMVPSVLWLMDSVSCGWHTEEAKVCFDSQNQQMFWHKKMLICLLTANTKNVVDIMRRYISGQQSTFVTISIWFRKHGGPHALRGGAKPHPRGVYPPEGLRLQKRVSFTKGVFFQAMKNWR